MKTAHIEQKEVTIIYSLQIKIIILLPLTFTACAQKRKYDKTKLSFAEFCDSIIIKRQHI